MAWFTREVEPIIAFNLKTNKPYKKMSKMMRIIAALIASGMSHLEATKQATFMTSNGSPIFTPTRHTKMSYAKQNRLAKKRRNKSMYSK